MMAMKDYEGKRIYVSLNTSDGKRRYSGTVLEVVFIGKDVSGVDIHMITINDKFDKLVSFTDKEIEFMEEER